MIKSNNLVESQLAAFGINLKSRRLRNGWTLDDLAERSGFSKPFLSRLESGNRQASIAAVLTLSQIFNVSLAEMFETQLALEPCLIIRGAEAIPHQANGLTYTPLSGVGQFFNLQPLRVTISLQRQGTTHYQHEGEEWIYVLTGQLTLSLAGKQYDLNPGDAVHFDSRLPHRIIARGKTPPEILLVASPLALERSTAAKPIALLKSSRAIQLPAPKAKEDNPGFLPRS